MEDPNLYWTKVAAIGQAAGAIATFAAVVVALIQSRSQQSLRVRVRARFGIIAGEQGHTEVMTYEVENIGLRPFVVNGIYWSTGLANRLGWVPPPFRLKSAFQLPDYHWAINTPFPWRLNPGESKSTHMRRADFIASLTKPRTGDLSVSFFGKRNRNFSDTAWAPASTRATF